MTDLSRTPCPWCPPSWPGGIPDAVIKAWHAKGHPKQPTHQSNPDSELPPMICGACNTHFTGSHAAEEISVHMATEHAERVEVSPDSELRAAIDKIMGQVAYHGDALNLDRSRGNAIKLYNEVRTDIEALVRPLLAAERTAIKADTHSLGGWFVDVDPNDPGKLIANPNGKLFVVSFEAVTQVIDGREGV